jgi:hypothetical protein
MRIHCKDRAGLVSDRTTTVAAELGADRNVVDVGLDDGVVRRLAAVEQADDASGAVVQVGPTDQA